MNALLRLTKLCQSILNRKVRADGRTQLPRLRSSRGLKWRMTTACLIPCAAGAFELDTVSTSIARAGETVTLTGTGFDPAGTWRVLIGETEVSPSSVTAEAIGFVVPAGVRPGRLGLREEGGAREVTDTVLDITRLVSAGFDASLPLNVSGYGVGTFAADSEQTAAPFSVDISVGEPTFVSASRLESEPVFMAVATDTTASVTLSARSTALAMLFSFPGIYTSDPEDADTRLAYLNGLPAMGTAETAINSAVAAGMDFSGSAALRAALLEALVPALEFATREAPAAQAGRGPRAPRDAPPGDPPYREDYVDSVFDVPAGSPPFPHYLAIPGFDEEDFRQYVSRTAPGDPSGTPLIQYSRNDRGVPTAVFPFGDRKWELLPYLTFEGTPVDHMLAAYRIRTNDFSSISQIRNQEGSLSQVYLRSDNFPVFTDIFSGGGSTKLAGYPLSLSPYIDKLTKAIWPTQAGNREVVLPRDQSGLYLIRMFNGTVVSPQDQLIAALPDGSTKARLMFTLNCSLALMETVGVIVKGGKLRGAAVTVKGAKKSSGGLVTPDDIFAIARSMAIEIDRKLARGQPDYAFLVDVFLKGVRQAAKIATDKAIFEPFKPSLKNEVARVKNVLSALDLLTDIPQAGARIHFTFNLGHYLGLAAGSQNVWTTLGVDSLLVAVGDPLRPEITRFSPAGGQRGSVVVLHGQNFSAFNEDNLVRFGDPGTSPEDPLSGSPPALVIAASRTMLVVEVPELPGSNAPVVTPVFVTVLEKGTVSSQRLAPGRSGFTVLADPEILAINPDPPVANGLMEIAGQGFDPELSRNRVFIDNGIELPVSGGDSTRLMVRVPNTDAPVNVRVVSGSRGSNVVTFTPVRPEYVPGDAPAGWELVVSTVADGNAADAHLTLREAMLLAAGGETGSGLGRPITRRPENSPLPWESFESDWIFGWDRQDQTPGVASRDPIYFETRLDGTPLVAGGVLPGLRRYDSVNGRGVTKTLIQGGGFVIDGESRVSVSGLTLSQFPAAGVSVSGSSSQIQLSSLHLLAGGTTGISVNGPVRELFVSGCLIDFVSDAGIFVSGGAHTGFFSNTAVRNAMGHGVVLSGAVQQYSFDGVDVRNCGGSGISLSGTGVKWNRFLGAQRQFVLEGFPLQPVECSENGGYGVLIENGGSDNEVDAGDIRSNSRGGVRVTGAATSRNRIGPPETTYANFYPIVSGNAGAGILAESPGTSIGGLNIVGNTDGPESPGHGIFITGPAATDITVHAVRIGYDNRNTVPTAMPNSGSGIAVSSGAKRILLGTLRDEIDNVLARNFIGGNATDGIVIAGPGTADVRINHTDVGRIDNGAAIALYPFYARPITLFPLGNGGHGISVKDGARDVVIGSRQFVRDVHVVAHTAGAGIRIAGADTTNVTVLGSHIGTGYFGENEGNLHGIQITEGSGGNMIGLQGNPVVDAIGPAGRLYAMASHNTIMANLQSGILLEAGGAFQSTVVPGQPPPTPANGNVIINNYIGTFNRLSDEDSTNLPNGTGILIRGQAFANRIGGNAEGEGNQISYNNRAGIEFSGVTIPNPALSNRITGNTISLTGSFVNWPSDYAAATDAQFTGIGVLFTGGAGGNILGEESSSYNNLNNNAVGVMIDGPSGGGGAGNRIVRCRMRSNGIAGVMLRNTGGNTVGPQCIERQNGLAAAPFLTYGGVAVIGGPGGNRIVGNIIGSDEFPSVLGNKPDGILVLNSPGNQIGEPGSLLQNQVVSSSRHGILVSGAGSSGNRIQGNRIGVRDHPVAWSAPNAGSGIQLESGASNNRIGGPFIVTGGGVGVTVSAGNIIRGNGNHGVLVDGSATAGNEILDNSITSHAAGRGIENINGGNHELPPPVLTSVSSARIEGTVDRARVPDGSTVQAFADTGDEGRDLIGETVVKDGKFTLFPAAITAPRVNATVTHLTTHSTSGFSVPGGGGDVQGLTVRRRAGSAPQSRTVPANERNAILVPVEFTAVNADALVDRIRLTASGSANEAAALGGLSVWLDRNTDGAISAGDTELVSGVVPPSNDGTVELPFEVIVPANATMQLLVTANLTGAGAVGETLEFKVADAQAVDSFGQPTPFPLPENGVFPVAGDLLTLGEPEVLTGFDGFLQAAFPGITDPAIIGPDADPDGDGATNFKEYAEGTDPAHAGPQGSLTGDFVGGELVLQFRQRNDDPKLTHTVQFMDGTGNWAPDAARILEDRVVSTSGAIDLREVRVSLAGVQSGRFFARISWTLAP